MPNGIGGRGPNENYMGRPYSDWMAEYMNWLVRPKLDANNDGEVIFLRGFDFPNGARQNNIPSNMIPSFQDIEPMMKVGNDALSIPSDKPIFFPLVMAIGESVDNKLLDDNELCRRNYVRKLLSSYTPSRNEIILDGKPLMTNEEMKEHKVESKEFILDVPNVSYGASLKDFMNIPLKTAGKRSVVINGYFFMLHLALGKHNLRFHSNGASAGMLCGSDALYSIIVHKNMSNAISDRHVNKLLWKLQHKFDEKEIDKDEFTNIMRLLKKNETSSH